MSRGTHPRYRWRRIVKWRAAAPRGRCWPDFVSGGRAGPIVIHLTAPGADGTSSGCVSADPALIKAIRQNPENYYINVHTLPLYGAGAVRAQLSK